MEPTTNHASLEEILTAVEQDASLREGSVQDAPTSADAAAGEGTLSDTGLGALLSQTDILSKLPEILKVMQTLRVPPSSSEAASKKGTPIALLTALRPYLNDNRRQAIDAMIRISQLSDSLRLLH